MNESEKTAISQSQKKYFRQIGHQLHPVVTVGNNGLSENVLKELEGRLNDHELIKVKINADDREQKAQLTGEIVEATAALVVQAIGHVLLLYRPAEKPDPKLSNLLRNLT